MEPFSMIVGAVALGASSALKKTASKAVEDAYHALVTVIKDRYRAHVHVTEALESLTDQPQDKHRQAALENNLKLATTSGDPANERLYQAAQQLITVVEAHGPTEARSDAKAIGMDIGLLRTAAFNVRNVQVPAKSGTGMRIQEVVCDDATIEGIGGGSSPPTSEGPKA